MLVWDTSLPFDDNADTLFESWYNEHAVARLTWFFASNKYKFRRTELGPHTLFKFRRNGKHILSLLIQHHCKEPRIIETFMESCYTLYLKPNPYNREILDDFVATFNNRFSGLDTDPDKVIRSFIHSKPKDPFLQY